MKSALGYGQARKVLKDVWWIRNRLEIETDNATWRILWIASVTLLRTVGHVARKVDGETDPLLAEACNQVFQTWKHGDEHKIFREFINEQRNLLLKEYDTGMSEGDTPVTFTLQNPEGKLSGYNALLGENIYRPMKDGPWEGQDGREVIDEALAWWNTEILRMEALVDLLEIQKFDESLS
ncbi:MAG: hypothetical protein ACSHX3_01720 [Litorimonas sp.]